MRRLCAIVLALSVIGAGPTSSASGQSPITGPEATQTFVIARSIEVRAIGTVINTGIARMETEAARIRAECPGVLAHAPIGHEGAELSTELRFDLLLAMYRPLDEPISGFAEAMVEDHLHWGDRRVHRLVYAYVREQASFASLHAPPDVCADARAWAASGYATLSAETTRFGAELQHVANGEAHGTKERLVSALSRHMTRKESAVLSRAGRLETQQTGRLIPRWTSAVSTVSASLGIPPSQSPLAHAPRMPVV